MSEPMVETYPLPFVALLTLNRPEALNAINSQMARMIEAAATRLDADPQIRVVVITGAGERAFCSGADIKEMSANPEASRRTPAGGFAGFVDLPRAKPWIAAIEGPAVGGGLEIALACELRVASETASFALPEVKRSNLAVGGGLRRLQQLIPRAVALEMIMTGEPIGAARAYELGLINALTAGGQALSRALSIAEAITRAAPLAVAESLRIARLADQRVPPDMIAIETAAWDEIRRTEDYREGALSFIEKRPPVWKGR